MDKFYYLVAQLPRLLFNRQNAINEEGFLDEAGKWLSPRDLSMLSTIKLDGTAPFKKGPRVWQAYQDFERFFREEIARWREARHNNQDYKPAFPVSLVKEGNPLEIEKKLLHHRWNFLEVMEKDHHFDIDNLVLYMLKLQILSRLATFSKEKGQAVFERLIEDNPNPPGSQSSDESEIVIVEKESQ